MDSSNYLRWKEDPDAYESTLSELSEVQREMVLRGLMTECYELRKSEYPTAGDLGDALYHQSLGDSTLMTSYNQKVSAVKQKYPKPPSAESYAWELLERGSKEDGF